MFTLKNTTVEPVHSENTLAEIQQQPEMWRKTFADYEARQSEIEEFLKKAQESDKKPLVIFTGAGTSEYVGNVVVDYLRTANKDFDFESYATTSIVSTPHLFLEKDRPTILVSFARSGNSPESLAAVELAERLVDHLLQLAITCAPDGKLAVGLNDSDHGFVQLMPEGTNDKGFAMTSSFSCMMLSALLIFDPMSVEEKKERVESVAKQVEEILDQSDRVHELIDFDFNRIVYLGSGPLYRLAKEARLKILELTAGEVAAIEESSMGFRHGPKSFINEDTVVVGMVSNDAYTRQYDVDILNECQADGIAKEVLALSTEKLDGDFEQFPLSGGSDLEDVYLSFPYIVVAQLFSLITSLHVGNYPDTPSKTGTVNRVVKGVQIHEL